MSLFSINPQRVTGFSSYFVKRIGQSSLEVSEEKEDFLRQISRSDPALISAAENLAQ